tara:strand:- start:26 stop:439 length:414 start_codon:yes stop_codon:yes gene_type:complete
LKNKISEKDKRDWENFITNKDKVENKDNLSKQNTSFKNHMEIDLHGYSLEEANKKIFKFINECYGKNIKSINVITGKGLRSKNIKDPYSSSDLGMLKNSVPDFIKNNQDLMSKIKSINFDEVASKNKGNFYIYLKKN